MFTIDLLKGQGIPTKTGPEGIAVAAVAFAVPTVIAIGMFGLYLTDRISISIQKREIVSYGKKTDKLSDAVELQKSFREQENAIRNCLSEVASSIGRHTQWSPVLTTVVENMPDSMVLTKLEMRERPEKRKVPKKDAPETKIDVTVPVTTLQINVSGNRQQDCAKAVRDFKDRLRFSTSLGPKLEDIRIAQHDLKDKLEGENLVSYEIKCIFKPKL